MSGSSSKSLGRFVLSEVCSARYVHSRDTTRHFAIIILVIFDRFARWSDTSTHCDRTSYHCSEIESTPPAHAVHADAPSGEQIGHSFMAGGLIRAWVRAPCYVEWAQTVRGRAAQADSQSLHTVDNPASAAAGFPHLRPPTGPSGALRLGNTPPDGGGSRDNRTERGHSPLSGRSQ
jgi:hypothetical protein